MQVSVETTQGLERKMTVAVPSEKVESAVNTRLQEAARNVKLNGFRKGKVPYKVIKSKFGAGVRQEVVGWRCVRVQHCLPYLWADRAALETHAPCVQPNVRRARSHLRAP